MILVIQKPLTQEEEYPWNQETKEKFFLDEADVALLEKGGTVWKGQNNDIAFELYKE